DDREVGGALHVFQDPDLERAEGGLHALLQVLHLVTGLDELRDAVLHFLLRLEHGVLVFDEQRLELRILHADVVGELSVVEDVPLDGRSDGVAQGLRREGVGQTDAADVGRERADVAEEGERGEQVALREADLGALRRRIELGLPHVRATAKEVGGYPDGRLLRCGRDAGGPVQQGIERTGRHAQEYAERVLGRRQRQVRRRDGGRRGA